MNDLEKLGTGDGVSERNGIAEFDSVKEKGRTRALDQGIEEKEKEERVTTVLSILTKVDNKKRKRKLLSSGGEMILR